MACVECRDYGSAGDDGWWAFSNPCHCTCSRGDYPLPVTCNDDGADPPDAGDIFDLYYEHEMELRDNA